MRKGLLYSIFYILFFINIEAQHSVNETGILEREVVRYLNETGVNALIYSGIEQAKYSVQIKGTPYLENEEYLTGCISYDNREYFPVKFRYNTHRDEIAVLTPGNFNVVLDKCFFNYAITDSLVIRLAEENGRDAKPFSGYYIELYSSPGLKVFEKNTSSLGKRRDDDQIVSYFQPSRSFYIFKDNMCYRIKKQKDALSLFRNHKKELQQYIKTEKTLDFKKDPRKFLIEIVKKYEELER